MKGDPKVLESLNEILTGELTSINQYFLHARMCRNWGYERLAKKIYEESIEEMRHASDLTDRILFLDGVPNLQKLDKLRIGETVLEQLNSDLAMEQGAMERLRRGIVATLAAADHVTRHLFEKILKEEEEHVDWLEAQLKLVSDIGIEHYLAQHIHKKDD